MKKNIFCLSLFGGWERNEFTFQGEQYPNVMRLVAKCLPENTMVLHAGVYGSGTTRIRRIDFSKSNTFTYGKSIYPDIKKS